VLHTRGHAHGPLRGWFTPVNIGQLIKALSFWITSKATRPTPSFGFHPHSGIATLTLILSGQVTYKETTEREGSSTQVA